MRKENSFKSPLPWWIANTIPTKALSLLYASITERRNKRYSDNPALIYQAPFPVISVGGIRAGGTGKTPSAMLLGDLLRAHQREIVFLSRGYKKLNKGSFIGKPGDTFSWHDTGDEPAMLHAEHPQSWLGIGADRISNAEKISSLVHKNAVFILDDGFQHRKIKRDLDIVCVNETLFNDKLLPRGYLREPVESLSRADVVFLIGDKQNIEKIAAAEDRIAVQFPHLDTHILTQEVAGWVNVATGEQRETLAITSPLAVCGIARPERFFATLKKSGIFPCKEIVFSDHHRFTLNDFHNLHKLYSNGIVLTEKDAIRLTEFKSQLGGNFWYLKVRLKFYCDDSLKRFKKKLHFLDTLTTK
jgi:tetraacyldisaccharide 4'-kinase